MTTIKPDGERLAILETETKTITEKVNSIENSVQSLHGKFDTFTKVLAENYVAKDTFTQWQATEKEKEKNRGMERFVWVMVTAIVTGLIAFFLREIRF